MLRDLNRKKDMVCLILSYPPFNSRNNETHISWFLDVLEIHRKVRESQHKENEVKFSELSSEIIRLLHHSIDDIEAHVPSDIIEQMCNWRIPLHTTPPSAMLDLCIDDFMIRHISQYIQIPEIRTIMISEETDRTLLFKLKKLPVPGRQMFDIVARIDVNLCKTIEDVEDRIIEELGFSKSRRGEADKFLRSQNFLILLHHFKPWIGLNDLGNGWWNSDKTQKITGFTSDSSMPADLKISRDHHLLSWVLFCRNVGEVLVHSSSIQPLAVDVLRQCSGHLLASVLIARALKDVKDVSIWRHASRAIGFLPTTSLSTEDRILLNALAFVLEFLGSAANDCLKYCASYLEMEGIGKVDLLERWVKENLIGTLDEGEQIVQELVNAVLLESFQNGESIRMPDEVRKELVNFYKAEMKPIRVVELDGSGLIEAPKSEAWEEASEMYLMNYKISKLPDNPKCHLLSKLFLQGNLHLRVISPSFFHDMPILQILNLSQSKIKSLPQSLFKLVQLRKFILRSCKLFKELPAEIGELSHLEVLDLENTEIIELPVTIGNLTKLTNLKVSFYLPTANGNGDSNPSNGIIPQNVISKLEQLEELSIDVNPEDKRWNATIKYILPEVCCLERVHFLKLHLPEVSLLNDLGGGDKSSLMKLSWMNFRFIVGNHLKCIISRLPHELVIKFGEQESYLKYVNGDGIPTEIKEVLGHATSFFLDRHRKATSLSQFGVKALENLKFCVLQECNEIVALVNANDADDGDVILQSLEYLSVHYMKNLSSIWEGGSLRQRSLSFLKVLTLYCCPKLTTIFTIDLVHNLEKLEELVVEDCPKINSLLLPPADKPSWMRWYLPKLKKLSLHYMPKLVCVCGGEQVSPILEWVSFYDCPSLEILVMKEVISSNLKVIIGEADWWSALKQNVEPNESKGLEPNKSKSLKTESKGRRISIPGKADRWSESIGRRISIPGMADRWSESKGLGQQNLDDIFIPIERDIDLRTQLAAINDQFQARMQITESTKQSGPGVEAQTSSKQKEVAFRSHSSSLYVSR